jgi:C-5 cytosine-specific DNA methylase.
MKSKGLKILEGFDVDGTCKYAYEMNNEAEFIYKDIRQVTKNEILPLYSKKAVKVLAGCAPCQPFSSYAFKNKNKDEQKYTSFMNLGVW